MLRKILPILLIISTVSLSAATDPAPGGESRGGKVTGRVVDKANNETLIGVPVMLEGTTLGAVTDLDGRFTINNVPSGRYSVVFRYIGYISKVIPEVAIADGEVTTLDISMETSSQQLKEVVVTADMKKESIGSILLMQKKSGTIQDGISSEAIKKTPDKNTGEVIRRVSGASIQDGRFVIIRGLNDRYNNATLNGVPLNSTEPDRKAFSFDLFPSSLLDNLIVTKTASPELSGDFAGGILQVNTRDIPDKSFFSFSAGSGLNTNSTGKSYFDYKGGKKDWLGSDDGTRALPQGFPESSTLVKSTIAQKVEYSKTLQNDWSIQEKNSSPFSQSYQLAFGTVSKVMKNDFGVIGALSYNLNHKTVNVERGDYDFDASRKYQFFDDQYKENVSLGGILNLSYKVGPNSKFSLKNLYSVNGEDMTIMRNGTDFENFQIVRASALRYSSTKFYNSILSGEHFLPTSKIRVKWFGSLSKTMQSIPDLRRMFYYRDSNETEDTTFTAYVPFGNAAPNYAGKFYSDLHENVYNGEINATFPVNFLGDNQSVKFGYFEQFKDRVFDARALGYVVTSPSKFHYQLLQYAADSIFAPENMGVTGFRIDEITNPSDHYTASSNLHAGYVQFDNLVHKFRFVWGIRIENFIQKLNSIGYSNDTIRVNTNYLDVLPSVNIAYSLTEKSNIRVAVSKTVARPEFRELAPFGFYDFSTTTTVYGNDSLQRTNIYNYDVRYELYPNAGQVLSTSLFYKRFINPIEPSIESSGAGTRNLSFENAPGAYVYGVELEWRKNLDFAESLIAWNQWEDISLYGNIALMKSVVDKSNDKRATGDRPLQGQSPYVINCGIMYNGGKSGLGFNLVYNKIGTRIFQVGYDGYLSIQEAPRNLIDLQISKRFLKSGEIKFTISDILNDQGTFYQDQNGDGKYNKEYDSLIAGYKYGTNYSLSVSYKF